MSKVIALKDIMEYKGLKTAEFSAGIILTPSAWDWAGENGLEVILNHSSVAELQDERSELLSKTVKAAVKSAEKGGYLISKENLVKIVTTSLERMGCIIENR